MKTLVIYYSYTGKTRNYATELAQKEGADLVEVKDKKARSKFNAYVFGSFAAMRQKEAELAAYDCDFSAYDKIIIAMPIWASNPAPAMNNIIHALPGGKNVELVFISASGGSGASAEKTTALIEKQGCKVVGCRNVKL